jgi:hypothetical protein
MQDCENGLVSRSSVSAKDTEYIERKHAQAADQDQ